MAEITNMATSETWRLSRSLVQAAWEKYLMEVRVMSDCLGIHTPKKKQAMISESGHLILPRRVILTDCGIEEAGQESEVAKMCRNVMELDLSNNQIASLEEVLRIVGCMPKLTFLDLTRNPLSSSAGRGIPVPSSGSPKVRATNSCSALPCPVVGKISADCFSANTASSITSHSIQALSLDLMTLHNASDAASSSNDATDTLPITIANNDGLVIVDNMPTETALRGWENEDDQTSTSMSLHPNNLSSKTVVVLEHNGTDNNLSSKTAVALEHNGIDNNLSSKTAVALEHNGTDNDSMKMDHEDNLTVCVPTASTNNNEEVHAYQLTEMVESNAHSTPTARSRIPSPKGKVNLVGPGCPPLSNIRQLVLNKTSIDWPGLVMLLRRLPRIDELHLSLNNYTAVDLSPGFIYQSLTRLYFTNNDIDDWSHINRLGETFPRLQHLFLAETKIASLDTDGNRVKRAFPALELLSLNKTQLTDWPEVEQLRLFPSLKDVRLHGIPFLHADDKIRRSQLIARLPNITRLNGSIITENERIDAERAFLRLFMDSQDKPDRYYELEKIHGKLDPQTETDVSFSTFRVNILMGSRQEDREVNAMQTVRQLKKSLETFAGLPSNKFVLYYRNKRSKECEAEKLEFSSKRLLIYNLADGDEIIIEPKMYRPIL